MVIMAPEMVTPMKQIEDNNRKLSVYMVREKWTDDGNRGSSFYLFTEYENAKAKMTQLISDEEKNGLIANGKTMKISKWIQEAISTNVGLVLPMQKSIIMSLLYWRPYTFPLRRLV